MSDPVGVSKTLQDLYTLLGEAHQHIETAFLNKNLTRKEVEEIRNAVQAANCKAIQLDLEMIKELN